MPDTEAQATATSPPRRNFAVLLAEGSLLGVAGQLASTNIVLPFMCAAVGGSLLVAGLLVPLNTLGTLLGYPLGPALLATRLRSRTVMALSALTSAALLAGLAAVSLLLPDRGVAVSVAFAAVALGSGMASATNSVAFSDVLARGVSPTRRNLLLLGEGAVGGGLAIAVALVSAWLLADRTPIVGHVALQWIAAGCLALSGVLALFVAIEHVPAPAVRRTVATTIRAGIEGTRRYAWLRRYLVRQVLLLSVALATTFFSIRVAALHGKVPGSLAVVVAVTSVALVAGAFLWHRILGRRGYRGMLVDGAACSALAALGAVLIERLSLVGSPVAHAVLILLATLGAEAVGVGKTGYLVQEADPDELPDLAAFAQLTIGLASAVVAAAIATLAQVHGTVWPPLVLLGLNLLAMVAALRMPELAPGTVRPQSARRGLLPHR